MEFLEYDLDNISEHDVPILETYFWAMVWIAEHTNGAKTEQDQDGRFTGNHYPAQTYTTDYGRREAVALGEALERAAKSRGIMPNHEITLKTYYIQCYFAVREGLFAS